MAFEEFTGGTYQEEATVQVELRPNDDGTGELLFPDWWLEQEGITQEDLQGAQFAMGENKGTFFLILHDRIVEVKPA